MIDMDSPPERSIGALSADGGRPHVRHDQIVSRRTGTPQPYDVAIVGGGPAGAMTAWCMARRGARVIVLDREKFPREKVCGDFVEPRGLRLIEEMGCGAELVESNPLPITHVAIFLESSVAYRDAIPFYKKRLGLPPHGYIVPRSQLDIRLLDAARKAGATVHEGCAVTGFRREAKYVELQFRRGTRRSHLRARLIVGADGVRSIVARQAGLFNDDPRYIAVSQRAYVENVQAERGEAAFIFDGDLFPGYGWMFPMAGGSANIGVGILSEARDRYSISVPALFQAFIDKLRQRHPGCAEIRVAAKPLGGIVKTYGGAGRNYFDGGVLVGDAGCFVDPMTGEGITPALESALIASSTLAKALENGRTDARHLSEFERDFRSYFDPAMRYLDLCATVMRNRHLSEFWLKVALQGCKEAAADPSFASVTGSGFGGLDIRPAAIFAQMWAKMVRDIGAGSARTLLDLLGGRAGPRASWLSDLDRLRDGCWRSLMDDPLWHALWTADVAQKCAGVLKSLRISDDPRLRGPPVP
jgi:menaquinone-9 beta-reductase